MRGSCKQTHHTRRTHASLDIKKGKRVDATVQRKSLDQLETQQTFVLVILLTIGLAVLTIDEEDKVCRRLLRSKRTSNYFFLKT